MRNRFSKQAEPAKPEIDEPKPSKQQLVKRELSNIETNIINLLEINELYIPKAKIPLLSKEDKSAHEEAMYDKIMQDKKKLEEKIKELQNVEKYYLDKPKPLEKSKVTFKAELTEQDRHHLKQLKKKLRDFEKSLEMKTMEIEQQKVKLMKEQEQRSEKQKDAMNERKRIKIQQKLQGLKQRNIERETQRKQEDNAIKKIEQKKKLYELLDENWKQKYNHEEQKKIQLMEMRLKQKQVNFSELKEHEKKYDQVIADKKREFLEKRLTSSRQSQNSSFSGSKSKYYTIVLREEQQAKQLEEKRKQMSKLVQKKRLQYSEYVREEHAPKLKTIENEEQPKKNEQPIIVRKTKEEIRQMGDFNLKQGNKRAKKKQNLESTNSASDDQKGKGVSSSMSHYHDYLKQIRTKKQQDNFYSGFHNSPKSEAEKIIKSQKINKEDKIAKLKLLATRFDSSSTDIIARIQGKLQILEVIN